MATTLLAIFKNQRKMEQRLLNFKSLVNVMLTIYIKKNAFCVTFRNRLRKTLHNNCKT